VIRCYLERWGDGDIRVYMTNIDDRVSSMERLFEIWNSIPTLRRERVEVPVKCVRNMGCEIDNLHPPKWLGKWPGDDR
jgi:hypothetical protein